MLIPAAGSPRESSPIATGAANASLHQRFLVTTAMGGSLLILLLTVGAYNVLERSIARQGDTMLEAAARRSALVLDDALGERTRETSVLAMMPVVVAAARHGSARAAALGLTRQSIPALEQRYSTDHSMLLAPDTRLLLRELAPRLDARDMLLTDANGFNAVITDRSGDFVQSDESWWQEAWRIGTSTSDAAFDPASRSSVVAVSSVIKDGAAKVGVIKVKFNVTPLVASLAAAGAGVRIDVLDAADHVLLSSDSTAMGSVLAGVPTTDAGRPFPLAAASLDDRAIMREANARRWRVVAHTPRAAIAAPYVNAKRGILAAAFAMLLILALLLHLIHRFIERRISIPAAALAEMAEAVAAGDFSVDVRQSSSDDEIGRLGRAVGAMVLELRRLAQAIAGSARETHAMSSEITAGSEEMAATAGEIANTASDLSVQATTMAETIGTLATSAASLRALAGELESGAHEGVTRNGALRALASDNRAGLDASARSLGTLSDDVHASAVAIEALAEASTEIRSFVTLVRKLARQSKLLALNAAMEAARAGSQGEGFAVVASEVRRLASMSSDAAERTEAIVHGVLSGIEESRASAGRAVAMADEVRESTGRASESFADIERAVAEAEEWTASVRQTSVSANQLVNAMTDRFDTLTVGTESFAAAMEQVAASSQEQSAATEEIAGASNALVSAADRLTRLVGDLKLGDLMVTGEHPARTGESASAYGAMPLSTLAALPA